MDPAYLSPFSENTRPALNESRSGSEPDSLLDLYGHPRRSTAEPSQLASTRDEDTVQDHEGAPAPEIVEDDTENSRWIHRDKLLAIESKEMQELGITPPSHKRTASRSKHRRGESQDPYENGNVEPAPVPEVHSAKEGKKRRLRSPIRSEEPKPEIEPDGSPINNDFDLRTPEEIAAESSYQQSQAYAPVYHQTSNLRSSSSRIPLPRSSPMPIPQEHRERNQPLPRKRGASSGEEDISYPQSRSRNNSVGSQILLDSTPTVPNDPDPIASTSPAERLPPSSTSPSKPRGLRKPSTSTSTPTPKPRTPSSTTTNNNATARSPSNLVRPKSRSGLEPRPPTAINRPEGDPPWLADMYAPDPRLPPEEQVIPTHAKKLQAEQWEKARKESEARRGGNDGTGPTTGRSGKVTQQPREAVTRGFSPVAVHTPEGLRPPDQHNGGRAPGTWPLHGQKDLPVVPPKNSSSPVNPISPAEEREKGRNGGYSAMPRVRASGVGDGNSARNSAAVRAEKPLDPFERERLSRETGTNDEKGKKEKETGCCGGCLIM